MLIVPLRMMLNRKPWVVQVEKSSGTKAELVSNVDQFRFLGYVSTYPSPKLKFCPK